MTKHYSKNLQRLTIVGALAVALMLRSDAAGEQLNTFPVEIPPTVDGVVADGEWNGAGRFEFGSGFLRAVHDPNYLYILLDVARDTTQDPMQLSDPWGDYFWFTFDVDHDANVTANIDFQYAEAGATPWFGYQHYIAPQSWTPMNASNSSVGRGFGPTDDLNVPHRFWEFAFDRTEIGAAAEMFARIGFRVHSVQPDIEEDTPANYMQDFADLIEIRFGDCNANGVPDTDDIATGASLDCDADGIPDECDEDLADQDGDGVADGCDNCPADPNPGQEDADADGIGDLCDPEPDPDAPFQIDEGGAPPAGSGFRVPACGAGIGAVLPLTLGAMALTGSFRRRRPSQ